jgi:hypothetical protein
VDERYDGFPDGFFARADESPDDRFYVPPRLVTHIDEGAIAAVGDLYDELGLTGEGSTSARRGCRTSGPHPRGSSRSA